MKNSTPDLAFRRAKAEDLILSSIETLIELSRVIIKEKFNKYVDIETRLEFLFEFKRICEVVTVVHSVTICRDIKDNMYLNLALSGNADAIIPGDKDLVVLNPFKSIPIITPVGFLESLT